MIERADPADPQIAALLLAHAERARAETGRGSAHALDPDGFHGPDIALWTIREGDEPVSIGALLRLSTHDGELEAMYTLRPRGGAASQPG